MATVTGLVEVEAGELRSMLEGGHNAVRAREKRCNRLKSGGGGGGDSAEPKLTITLEGASQTRNLKTNAVTPPPHSPGATVRLQSGQSYGGTVTVTGTLPAGDTVYVAFHGRVWANLGSTSGSFSGITEAKGFGAANDVGAYACKGAGAGKGEALPGPCSAGAIIDINWNP